MTFKKTKNSQKYKITYILIALNITFYLYGALIGGNAFVTSPHVVDALGQNNFLVLEHGLYYQIFTSMFIHVSLIHLASNLLFLLFFGLRAEDLFSIPAYLCIYFIGGLTGNLLTLAYGPNYISVGASGAIFAVLGACIIYNRKPTMQSIISALAFTSIILVVSMGKNVNILAHIGGLVFGLIIGYILSSKYQTKTQNQYTNNYSYQTS
jgi:rhomboid protease GluP